MSNNEDIIMGKNKSETFDETNKEETSVAVLLDNSGSMETMGVERIQSVRKLYEDQKAAGGRFRSTLAIFSNKMEYIHQDVPGSDIGEIEDFKPNGMTALYDSVVAVTLPFILKGVKNGILVIITDGLENASVSSNSSAVKTQIGILEKMGWKITYLGANQDSFTAATNIGINHSCDYEATPDGFRGIMKSVSDGLTRQITGEGTFELKKPKLVRTDAHAGLPPLSESDSTNFDHLLSPVVENEVLPALGYTISHM